MRILFALIAMVLLALPAQAQNNYAVTPGVAGYTFNATNVGGILYPGIVNFNSAGTELFTSGNAGYVRFPSAQTVTGSGGTFPVTQSTNPWTISGNVGQSGTWNVGNTGLFPNGATAIEASATGTTAATTATLGSVSAKTTYICGFSIRANATASSTGNATVTGVTTTMNYTQWVAPAASGVGVAEMIFPQCLPASGTNTAINVNSIAAGTGGTTSVTAWGYQL